MKLCDLINVADLRLYRGSGDHEVLDLVDDSRCVMPGSVFVARCGSVTNSHIADAVARGAIAVIGSPGRATAISSEVALACPALPVSVDQVLAGRLAGAFFGWPATQLRVIGVTGTNGKTTTAWIARHLLQQIGWKTGLIGTIVVDDGADPQLAELTTPGTIQMHRFLARMVANGCEAVVMEVSSHALHQHRIAGVSFDSALFTNLSGDHLDYHGTMVAYAAAKAMLFDGLHDNAWAIVNAQDPYAPQMIRHTKGRIIHTGAGEDFHGPSSRISDVRLGLEQSRATFVGPWGSFSATLPLVGHHNLVNALQAVTAVYALTETPNRVLREALESCPRVPGRLERVGGTGGHQTPNVFVDYAHTHDALEHVLKTLRPLVSSRLFVLIGCGGDRDRTKRAKMARVACQQADWVYLTSDNPRTEDPQAIIADMLVGVDPDIAGSPSAHCRTNGCGHGPEIRVIVDRAEAIRRCVLSAEPDDTVLLAGKGHENYQIVGQARRQFDDREHAARALGFWRKAQVPSCRIST